MTKNNNQKGLCIANRGMIQTVCSHGMAILSSSARIPRLHCCAQDARSLPKYFSTNLSSRPLSGKLSPKRFFLLTSHTLVTALHIRNIPPTLPVLSNPPPST